MVEKRFCFLQHIFLNKLEDSHFTAIGYDPIKEIPLDQFFLLPQGKIIPFACGKFICLFQLPAVHKLRLTIGIYVFESISSIFALALSITKNAVLVVSSFTAHDHAPFNKKEPRHHDMLTLYHGGDSISIYP